MGPISFGMMRQVHGMAEVESEYQFLVHMLPHHMAAVMVSQQLLNRNLAEHPEVAELAANIRANQLAEIEQMGRWLDRWAE